MTFMPVVGTLAYVHDTDTGQVLMIRRDARPSDDHFGKVNGLGGKLEQDEDVISSLRRELFEEANIELTSFALRGTITWSNFGPKREDWLGFVFVVDGWTGAIPATNEEGSLEWVPLSRLLQACDPDLTTRERAELPMWPGDRHFVPLVFDDDRRMFHGTMPYDGSEPIGWSYQRI